MKQLLYDLELFLFRISVRTVLTHAALDVRFLKEFISSRNQRHHCHHSHHFHYFSDHLPGVSNVNVMAKLIGHMEKKKRERYKRPLEKPLDQVLGH